MARARSNRLLAMAGCAVALMAATAPTAAKADVTWLVTGVFDDGGLLSGYFKINVYGFLAGYDLSTTAGSKATGVRYTPGNSYYSNGDFRVDAQPGYFGDLRLTFLTNLSLPAFNNPILGGSPGPSWECQGSWSCYLPEGGAIRYLSQGSAMAETPEPAAWALMILGFGGAGAALRLARRKGDDGGLGSPALTD